MYDTSECNQNFEAFVDVICGGRDEVDHVYDGERAGSNDGLLWKGRLPPSPSPQPSLIESSLRWMPLGRPSFIGGKKGGGKAVSLRPAD